VDAKCGDGGTYHFLQILDTLPYSGSMGLPGDPDELERIAAKIAADAEGLRGQAGRLAGHAAGVKWESTAAEEFRGRVGRDVAAVRSAAEELDGAAAELRRHAATVRERAAILRAEAERVLHGVEHAAGAVVHGVEDVVHGIGNAAKKLGGIL
jgi:hypothetical protein